MLFLLLFGAIFALWRKEESYKFSIEKLNSFPNVSPGFIFKTFLKFRTFHLRCSFEIYSYIKKYILMLTKDNRNNFV